MKRMFAAAALAAALTCCPILPLAHAQAPPQIRNGGGFSMDRWNPSSAGVLGGAGVAGAPIRRGPTARPAPTARQLDQLVSSSAGRVHISEKLSRAEQAKSREAVTAAIRVILAMKSNGTLPAGAQRAFAAHGTISVSHDVSGWSRHKDNFNMNIRDLELHLRNDSRFQGVSAVEIAADIIHDGWHVLQHAEGRSPVHHGFAHDPGACGGLNERAQRFNQIVVANEREANAGVVEFYRAVPGLPAYVRTHLINSVASPSDQDLLARYRGRRRTDVAASRGC